MAQELYELPQGWEWKTLSELAKTTSGGTPKRSQKSYWGGNIPWVKSGELGDSLIQKNSEYITQEGLNNSSAKLFPKGALLIALYGATAGKLGILDFEAATNQAVCYINPDKTITFEHYLWLFFSAIRQQIIEDSFGGAQPNISQSYLRNLQIPVPPLAEQERIVAKLDALFSRIDQAIAQLQHTQAQTKALFASALDAVFSKSQNRERIGDFCFVKGGKRLPKGQKLLDEPTNYPYIRVADFTNEGTIDLGDIKYISKEIHERISRYVIHSDDLNISIAGTIGKTGIIPK